MMWITCRWPNQKHLIHLEKRDGYGTRVGCRAEVVSSLESDLRSPSRARRTDPRLVRPEKEHKPVWSRRLN
jgi:hypothetical protein